MPNSMKIRISSGKRSVEEIFDASDIAEIKYDFEERQSGGLNPHFEKITFEKYIRPLKISMFDLDTLNISDNNTHWCTEYVGDGSLHRMLSELWHDEENSDYILEVIWN